MKISMSSTPNVTNLANKGKGKGEDINSSQENENSVLSPQLAHVTPPLQCKVQHPRQRERPLLCALKAKTFHIQIKLFFAWGDSNSHNVVDSTNNDSTIEHKEIGGKDETLVKNDCNDLGIGVL